MNEYTVEVRGFHELLKVVFFQCNISHAHSLISGIYGAVVTSQNGGDKALDIARRGSWIRESAILQKGVQGTQTVLMALTGQPDNFQNRSDGSVFGLKYVESFDISTSLQSTDFRASEPVINDLTPLLKSLRILTNSELISGFTLCLCSPSLTGHVLSSSSINLHLLEQPRPAPSNPKQPRAALSSPEQL